MSSRRPTNPRQIAGSCHCVVPGCSNEFYKTKSAGRHHHYHSLPQNRRDVLRRWLDAMQLRPGVTPPVGGRVCSDHFTAADYNMKYRLDGATGKQVLVRSNHLKRDAVPSVFINCGRETSAEKSETSGQQQHMGDGGDGEVPPRRMTIEDMPPEDLEITSWEWDGDPSSDGANAEAAAAPSGTATATAPPPARGPWWAGGGVHLQCPLCGHFSKSHAHLLTHAADVHPGHLDSVPVGRLGAIMIYQSTARLFHCYRCYFTTKHFPNLYDHIVSTHCADAPVEAAAAEAEASAAGGGGEEDGDKPLGCKAEEEVEEAGEAEKVEKEESLKRKRSSEGDDVDEEAREEEEEGEDDGGQKENDASAGTAESKDESKGVLRLEGTYYCCQVCDFKTPLKGMGILHVVKKHKIPRAYAYATAPTRQHQPSSSSPSNEEEVSNLVMMASTRLSRLGASSDLLTEEMKARAKVVKYAKGRYVCLICGWNTKSKGFIFSHVVRSHQDIERPYSCKECQHCFLLPSHLQQHMSTQHRAGCYGCPFCSFRSRNVGGFKRHCRRCAVRDGGEEGGGGGGGGGGGAEEKAEEEGAEASDGEEEKGEEASDGEQEKGEKKGQEEGEEKGQEEGEEKGQEEGEEKGEGEQASDGEQEKEKKGEEKGE